MPPVAIESNKNLANFVLFHSRKSIGELLEKFTFSEWLQIEQWDDSFEEAAFTSGRSTSLPSFSKTPVCSMHCCNKRDTSICNKQGLNYIFFVVLTMLSRFKIFELRFLSLVIRFKKQIKRKFSSLIFHK